MGRSLFLLVNFHILLLSHVFAQEIKDDSLEVITRGSVSIYKSGDRFYLESDTSFLLLPPRIEKHLGEAIKIETPYKGILNYYLKACSQTTQRLKSFRLIEKELIKLMTEYYSCVNEKPEYIKPVTKPSFYIGVASGIQWSKIIAHSPDRDIDEAVFEPSYSILLTLSYQFNFKDNFSLGAEHTFLKIDFTGKSEFDIADTNIKNDFHTSFTQFQNRIFVLKYFGQHIKPYIKAGPAINFNSNFDRTWIKTEKANSGPEQKIVNNEFYTPKNVSFGVFGAFGVSIPLQNEKLKINMELRYEALNEITKPAGTTIQFLTPMIATQLGMSYRF